VSLSFARHPGIVAAERWTRKGSAEVLEDRVVGREGKACMKPDGSLEVPVPRTGCAGRVLFDRLGL
jgi:hypothetical protein